MLFQARAGIAHTPPPADYSRFAASAIATIFAPAASGSLLPLVDHDPQISLACLGYPAE